VITELMKKYWMNTGPETNPIMPYFSHIIFKSEDYNLEAK
jgi:hypothetical protein